MKKIKELRKLKKISQFRLAQISGIGRSKISLWENRYSRPTRLEMRTLLQALNNHSENGGRP